MKENENIFGTDGVRGVVNENLTPKLAFELGKALAIMLCDKKIDNIIVGGDTRLSTNLIKFSFASGALSHGINIIDIGIVPTPCVSQLCKLKNTFGVAITASHNPIQYNGIKFFENDGSKISDDSMNKIGYILSNLDDYGLQKFDKIGKYEVNTTFVNEYCNYLFAYLNIDLSKIKVAYDCSNGACSQIVQDIAKELNLSASFFNTNSDGNNINNECGALYPEFLSKTIGLSNFDIGFSFDGDGDRLVCILKDGTILDGDKILYVLCKYLKKINLLYGDTIVASILSNFGFEHSLNKLGVKVLRTDVGDRNITKKLNELKLCLGGEKAGHIIVKDFCPTGDAIFVSLLILKLQKMSGIKIETMLEDFVQYPYIERNIDVPQNKKSTIMNSDIVKKTLDECLFIIGDNGRIVLRPSGTENKIRVLVEGKDKKMLEDLCKKLSDSINYVIKYS